MFHAVVVTAVRLITMVTKEMKERLITEGSGVPYNMCMDVLCPNLFVLLSD